VATPQLPPPNLIAQTRQRRSTSLRLEPSNRFKSVDSIIWVAGSRDALQLTVNEPRPVLDKPIVGFVVLSKKLYVSRRLKISTGKINEAPCGRNPITLEARPGKRLGLEPRVSEDISIWQLNFTSNFVIRAHRVSSPNAEEAGLHSMIGAPR
jgi:hypothetical protein